MKSNETREVPEEAYQELLETERKYLILRTYLQALTSSLGAVKDNLDSFLKED